MGIHKISVTLVAALMLTGCSTLAVNYDFNQQADFTTYKTYDWLPLPNKVEVNELNRQRFVAAVNDALSEKGLKLDTSQADIKIATHFGKSKQIQVTDWGYDYASLNAYYGQGYLHPNVSTYPTGLSVSRQINVYEYETGTLILDFIDSTDNTLVWRATAKAVINPASSPEKQTQKINRAVNKILENFPPN